jgi:hypothetical protein
MNLVELLTSPAPATGWSLDPAMAAVVRRHAKSELRCAAAELPAGVFDVGPVGLQAVDEDALRPVLGRLHDEVEGSKRVSVIVPTGWVRTHLLEFEQLPRRQAEIHELVIWRLKKLLPVPPASLRLALVPVPQRADDDTRRLLVMVGVERALAALEAVFEAVGASPGIITPRIFAAVDNRTDTQRLLVIQQERGFLGLILLLDGAPAVIRTKPLPMHDWAVVERELGLTMGFAARTFDLDDGVAVVQTVEDPNLADRVRSWVDAADGLTPVDAGAELPSRLDGTAVRDRAGGVRIDPLVSAVSGGLR